MFDILDYIGFYGPLILVILNMIFMWKQKTYALVYFIAIIVNEYLNQLLKLVFKQSRPMNYNISENVGATKYMVGPHKYGMPSGHSQSVFFSMMYVWLVTQSVWVLIAELFVCLLTVIQRWQYKKHTIEQLGVGAVIGMLFAYVTVSSVNRWFSKKYTVIV
jgi:membrane-associated phospholipid phosphatase